MGRHNVTDSDSVDFSGAWLDVKFNNNQNGSSCFLAAADAPTDGCYAGGNNAITNAVMFEKINGLTQPHAPAFSANVSYTHTWNLASGAALTAGAQIFVTTGYYTHPIENSYSYQPTYTTQSLNTGYTAPSGNWNVNAYVHNLSNYAVKESYVPQNIGEPRTYGVTASYHF
jgi:iron complex outermembrane receptor protein